MQTIPNRVWTDTDTDAACGTGPRVDPDDCLAFQALLENFANQRGRRFDGNGKRNGTMRQRSESEALRDS